jgi:hypothetical protein
MAGMFRKILIANRGEIAVRVIKACREMGIASVAVFSDADADAPHVRSADEAVPLGPPPAAESYLHMGKIVAAARATGAEAIHPGYGFLAENAAFARLCEQEGLVFIGPSSAALELVGDKVRARQTMDKAGVPTVPGMKSCSASAGEFLAAARALGYPVMVKASAGGGGKGMRVVPDDDGLERPRSRPAGSEVGLRRRRRLPREVHRGAAPRRIPGPGRQPWPDGPPVRAGVLDPAPPPKDPRGIPVAGPGPRAPARDGGDGRAGHAGGRIQQRRDGRVPPR